MPTSATGQSRRDAVAESTPTTTLVQAHFGTVTSEALQFINLIAAAVLTGNELGTWAVVHPAIAKLSMPEEVAAEQAITRRYGFFMPGLMLLTVVSGFAAASQLDSGSDAFALTLAASACFALMLAITLAGNVPLNVRTLGFDQAGSVDEWRAIRRRWDRLHTARNLLSITGLAFTCLGPLSRTTTE